MVNWVTIRAVSIYYGSQEGEGDEVITVACDEKHATRVLTLMRRTLAHGRLVHGQRSTNVAREECLEACLALERIGEAKVSIEEIR